MNAKDTEIATTRGDVGSAADNTPPNRKANAKTVDRGEVEGAAEETQTRESLAEFRLRLHLPKAELEMWINKSKSGSMLVDGSSDKQQHGSEGLWSMTRGILLKQQVGDNTPRLIHDSCDMHEKDDGPQGMMRSLIAQLLTLVDDQKYGICLDNQTEATHERDLGELINAFKSLVAHERDLEEITNTFKSLGAHENDLEELINTFKKSLVAHKKDLEVHINTAKILVAHENDLGVLINTFKTLVAQLEPPLNIICLLDSVTRFDSPAGTEDTQRWKDTKFCIKELLGLTENSKSGLFKLLLTSPGGDHQIGDKTSNAEIKVDQVYYPFRASE